MKKTLAVIALVLATTLSFSQRKIYNVDGNQKVKGTFSKLEVFKKVKTNGDQKFKAMIPSFTIAASVGTAVVNSALGAISTTLKKQQKKATYVVVTGPVTFQLNESILSDSLELRMQTGFYKRGAQEFEEMRTITLSSSFEKEKGRFSTNFLGMTSDFSEALVKKNRDMLIYELTISGKANYSKDSTFKTRDFSTVFLFSTPVANQPFTQYMPAISQLPVETSSVTLTASLKIVNPFYHNGTSLAGFLENYGESVAEVLAGLVIEPSSD